VDKGGEKTPQLLLGNTQPTVCSLSQVLYSAAATVPHIIETQHALSCLFDWPPWQLACCKFALRQGSCSRPVVITHTYIYHPSNRSSTCLWESGMRMRSFRGGNEQRWMGQPHLGSGQGFAQGMRHCVAHCSRHSAHRCKNLLSRGPLRRVLLEAASKQVLQRRAAGWRAGAGAGEQREPIAPPLQPAPLTWDNPQSLGASSPPRARTLMASGQCCGMLSERRSRVTAGMIFLGLRGPGQGTHHIGCPARETGTPKSPTISPITQPA